MSDLEIGQPAPDFSLPTDGGGTVSLSDLKGNMVVLYFYPKDDTPGCTKEAIAFTDLKKDFDACGAKIIGVSKDTPAKHDKFIAKHDLEVTLASDEDGSMIEAYGVWVEKNMYGRKYMGIERATYLIGSDGKILNIWRKVRVKGHVEAVLEAVKAATDMTSTSIIGAATKVLIADTLASKTAAAQLMYEQWQNRDLTIIPVGGDEPTPLVPDTPGRPSRPELVNPRDVKRRRLGTIEGRASLLHAIAHIEFNAINLAADMVARFALDPRIRDEKRQDFVSDWVLVCSDEARHFLMIETRLSELGVSYGDYPAHNGLWDAAISTKDDLAARLVIAPMVLEARGLDVTPKMIENLQKSGDNASADLLIIILNEEIAHVAAGARWFKHICEWENQTENAYFKALLATHFKGSLKPPFNVDARNLAGLSRSFYEPNFVEN